MSKKISKIHITILTLLIVVAGVAMCVANPFKVTDPHNPNYDINNFHYGSRVSEEEATEVMKVYFPLGTDKAYFQNVMVEIGGALLAKNAEYGPPITGANWNHDEKLKAYLDRHAKFHQVYLNQDRPYPFTFNPGVSRITDAYFDENNKLISFSVNNRIIFLINQQNFRFDGTFSQAETIKFLQTKLPLGSSMHEVQGVFLTSGKAVVGKSGHYDGDAAKRLYREISLVEYLNKNARSFITYKEVPKRTWANIDTGTTYTAYFDPDGKLVLITVGGKSVYDFD